MDSISLLLDCTTICRLCLSHDSCLTMIFSQNEPLSLLPSKIAACVGIEVESGDNLPDKICKRCIEQLENWLKFKELCDNANTLLLQCSAGLPPLCDEVLNKNLQGNNSDNLDIPEASSDFCFEDVSLLEHDSLLQTIDNSRDDSFESSGLLNNEPFPLYFQNTGNNVNEEKEKAEEDASTELNKIKWRKKYSRLYTNKFNCDICLEVFTKFSSLLKHDRIVHKDIVSNDMCSKCGQLFVSKCRLNTHDSVKHRDKIYECDVCGLKSVSYKSLKVHKVKHSGRFVCTACGVSTSTERSLQDHMTIHSEEKSYCCTVCDRTFKQRQSLDNHLKTHNSHLQPDFKCDICSRKFKTFRYLNIHKTSHVVEKSAICEICGGIFKNKNVLYVHKLTHQEKQHVCVMCNKTFSTRYLLNRHTVTHGMNSFKCSFCGKTYSRADTLSMHIKVHNSTQRYSCEQCDQTFTLNRYLKRHLARLHNREVN